MVKYENEYKDAISLLESSKKSNSEKYEEIIHTKYIELHDAWDRINKNRDELVDEMKNLKPNFKIEEKDQLLISIRKKKEILTTIDKSCLIYNLELRRLRSNNYFGMNIRDYESVIKDYEKIHPNHLK